MIWNNRNMFNYHKRNKLIYFICIIFLSVALGITTYSLLRQVDNLKFQSTQIVEEFSSPTYVNDNEDNNNNNFHEFIDISQPTDEVQSSVPHYSKSRTRRNILITPMEINGIVKRSNYHLKRQIEKIKKKNICKARYEYCEKILALIENDGNSGKKIINNVEKSLDGLNTVNSQSSEYLKCLECRNIDQQNTDKYRQSNNKNPNNSYNINFNDKSNNYDQTSIKTIEKKYLDVIKNISHINGSNNNNNNVTVSTIPIKYYLPLPTSSEIDDILTGPDFSNEMILRSNRNTETTGSTSDDKTVTNGTSHNTHHFHTRSPQSNYVNPRILSERPLYYSGQTGESKPLPTAETMKTGQQLQLTPSMGILSYPVCFYGTPQMRYPQARQPQPPIFYPSSSPYDHHSTPLYGIDSNPSSSMQIPSRSFEGDIGQGFVPLQPINYKPSSIKPSEFPQSTQEPMLASQYNDPRISPTGSGQNFAGVNYAGPFYCNFIPTFQFPSIPGDYQRSSGPAQDFQDEKTYATSSYGEDTWRSNSNVGSPINFSSNPQENITICKPSYLQCLDKRLCIPRSQWCDGKVDCLDASDETRCSCKDRIINDRLCDGYFDCPHGEDELGCFGCSQNAFSCEDWTKKNPHGNCLILSQRCDGITQCRNGKDEKDCSVLMDNDIDDEDIFTVGYASGYLYKNYHGKWYPACTLTRDWAIESCAAETGTSIINHQYPQMDIVPAPFTQNKTPYIVKYPNGQIGIIPDCNSKAIFVNCPPIPCGTRANSDYDRYRSRFEDILVASSHLNLTENQENNNRTGESKENEEIERILFEQEQSSLDSRIVGGRASQPKAWPSIVAIYKNGYYKCGGVIANEYWILTAAHCLEKYHTGYYEIHAGLLRRFSFSPMEQIRRAELIIIHPQYNSPLKINDLAMIRLNEPLRFNRWIRPICLPHELANKLNPGEICTTIGWGSTVEHGPEPDHLREVEVPIVSSCKLPSDKIEAVMCAGNTMGGKDACQGDSGGPMMCKVPGSNSQWYVAGIVSHGVGCARPDEPGAYTNISYFSSWINDIISGNQVRIESKPLKNCPGFSCDNGRGKCLPNQRKCDKNVDCPDAEDEINCLQNPTSFRNSDESIQNSPTNINSQNKSHLSPDDNEISPKKSINQLDNAKTSRPPLLSSTDPTLTTVEFNNFIEYTDDIITTMETPSSTTEDLAMATANFPKQPPLFACTKLVQSITMNARCNKIIDCEDGTDEINCTCKDILTNVHPMAICNGRVDCYDHTDEENCVFCQEDEYICVRSGTCIPLSKKCDGHSDCPLGEDELDCFALFNHPMLDADKRPAMGIPGVGTIIKDVGGIWKPYCSDDPSGDDNIRFVNQICQYLGFKGIEILDVVKKPNLTLLNEELDEIDSEFVVLASNSTLELSIENKTNECNAIAIQCRNTLISPAKSYYYANTSDPNLNYMWPWQGAILVEGKYHCPAIYLQDQWFLTSSRCTENIELNINATTLIVGMSPTFKHIPGPYEMTRNVTAIHPLKEFNVSLLTVDPYPLSRYVQPIFAEERFSAPNFDDECFAIGTDPKFNTVTLSLQSVPDNCPSCQRCFMRKIHHDECKNNTHDDLSGIITCRSISGWYPAAFFHRANIICEFQTPQSLLSIDQMFPYLIDIMDNEYILESELPNCDGVRCERGKCIPWKKVCDGIDDCEKGEDELTMSYCEEKKNICKNSSTIMCECSKSELKCKNGECISKAMFCDGNIDCFDGSDEPTECNCGEYLKLTRPELICDNIRHCYDKTDENKCDCRNDSYKCFNGDRSECIPYDFLCDGDKDCTNGEDEAICRMIKNNPKFTEFGGEILRRNYGIWHSECFPTPIQNDNQAQQICQSFGYEDGKVAIIDDSESQSPATQLEFDNFFMIRLSDKWVITTREDKPLVRLVSATEECHRAFVKCS